MPAIGVPLSSTSFQAVHAHRERCLTTSYHSADGSHDNKEEPLEIQFSVANTAGGQTVSGTGHIASMLKAFRAVVKRSNANWSATYEREASDDPKSPRDTIIRDQCSNGKCRDYRSKTATGLHYTILQCPRPAPEPLYRPGITHREGQTGFKAGQDSDSRKPAVSLLYGGHFSGGRLSESVP